MKIESERDNDGRVVERGREKRRTEKVTTSSSSNLIW